MYRPSYLLLYSWASSLLLNLNKIKLEFHDADTDTDKDILARILADTSDTRDFLKFIPMASSTTRRHSRDDPREDVSEEVRVGVGVGVVECHLNSHFTQPPTRLNSTVELSRVRGGVKWL